MKVRDVLKMLDQDGWHLIERVAAIWNWRYINLTYVDFVVDCENCDEPFWVE